MTEDVAQLLTPEPSFWERITSLLEYDASSPLIFNSGLFLFLFVGFMAGYLMLRRATSLRIIYVILFSIYFYYKSSGIYFMLLIFASVSDFIIAHEIARATSQRLRKWLVAASVAINVGMLGYFKYTNFLIEIANSMFGAGFLDFQNIFLPVGISFFVFQSMSYTIDVYRGEIRPLERWTDYMFYLSFFPQLVAGPIERPENLLPQLRTKQYWNNADAAAGLKRMLVGFFKKVVVAELFAVYLNEVYGYMTIRPDRVMEHAHVLDSIMWALSEDTQIPTRTFS